MALFGRKKSKGYDPDHPIEVRDQGEAAQYAREHVVCRGCGRTGSGQGIGHATLNRVTEDGRPEAMTAHCVLCRHCGRPTTMYLTYPYIQDLLRRLVAEAGTKLFEPKGYWVLMTFSGQNIAQWMPNELARRLKPSQVTADSSILDDLHRRLKRLREEGRNAEAGRVALELAQECKKAGSQRFDVMKVLVLAGSWLEGHASLDELAAIWEEAAQLAEERGEHRMAANSLLELSSLYLHNRKFDENAPVVERTIALCRREGLDVPLAKALNNKGYALMNTGRRAEALEVFTEARRCSVRGGDDELTRSIDGNMALCKR